MLRLTLDTNCVIHAAQGGDHQEQIDELVSLAQGGRVGLWLTSAFHEDQSRASGDRYRINLQWLSQRPHIGQVPGPFRLDYSTLGARDVLVADADAVADEEIKRILLPEQYRASPKISV
jgi:hypothetical protein